MALQQQDVVRALDDVRRLREDLTSLRAAVATADGSRAGRLRAAWFALKTALLGRETDPLRALGRERDAVAVEVAARRPIQWPGEARSAARARQERLRTEVAALRGNLAAAQALVNALAAERDAGGAAVAGLRAGVETLRRAAHRSDAARAAAQRHLERLQADVELLREGAVQAQDAAAARAAERDEERAAGAALAAELAAERATVSAVRAALAQLQAVVERERRSAREALNANAQLTAALGTVGAPAPPSELERKRLRLAATLERVAPFVAAERPDVSVIVPAYDQAGLTLDCLQSIADVAEDGPTMQIIVVDDASPNESVCGALAGVPHITVLRNGRNAGFLRSCNRASQLATGRYLHFLNNDTLVRAGWLRELVACADTDERIGAAGSKLLYADGSLQEAGGIVWRDASGWNYGRGDDADDPKYNYARDVDYCSGASLLVRRALFEGLGRFDETYAPAYFEDTDLCFAIREHGGRVVYQPKSVVVHLEGASSGTSLESGVKAHQRLNAPKFAAKWRHALERHYEPDSAPGIVAARRLQPAKTIVMIDSYVPEPDKDSGSNRLVNLIKLFLQLGVHVIFLPDNFYRSEPYTTNLQNLGVEVLHHTQRRPHFEGVLRERLAFCDYAWISRVDLAAKYMPIVRDFPDLPLLYDTVDLHHVRSRRELELSRVDDPDAWSAWERERELELDVIRAADVAIAVTDVERKVLEAQGIENVCVVPNVHEAFERAFTYRGTAGLLFIGGYQHPPNVDAAVWLCRSIMPIVWRTHPHIEVTLAGSKPPASVLELASSRVHVPGYVADVAPYFERARLFVAPLRYGAGLKGKIGQAFSYGVPTVTTRVGAEGFDLLDGSDALIAEDAAGFASAIVRAYDDPALWDVLSASASRIVRRFSPAATHERLRDALEIAGRRRPERATRA